MSRLWSMFSFKSFRIFCEKIAIFRTFDHWSEILLMSAGRPLSQGVCPPLLHTVQCKLAVKESQNRISEAAFFKIGKCFQRREQKLYKFFSFQGSLKVWKSLRMCRKHCYNLIDLQTKYSFRDRVPLSQDPKEFWRFGWMVFRGWLTCVCVGGGHERLARGDLDHGADSSRQHSQHRLGQYYMIYSLVSCLVPTTQDYGIQPHTGDKCFGSGFTESGSMHFAASGSRLLLNPDPMRIPTRVFLWKENNFLPMSSPNPTNIQAPGEVSSPTELFKHKISSSFFVDIFARLKPDPDHWLWIRIRNTSGGEA